MCAYNLDVTQQAHHCKSYYVPSMKRQKHREPMTALGVRPKERAEPIEATIMSHSVMPYTLFLPKRSPSQPKSSCPTSVPTSATLVIAAGERERDERSQYWSVQITGANDYSGTVYSSHNT
eukprot:4877-Heterococcus_DN1.PRE.2